MNYEYLGNLSAVDPPYQIFLQCHFCRVEWTGCWDQSCCPWCGSAEDFTQKTADK